MARRQVSIFINGREVENTLKSIGKEKRKVNNELRNMVLGSEEYNAKMQELKKLDGIISGHRDKLKGIDGIFGKMGGMVKGFGMAAVAAFSVGAVVEYGSKLFDVAQNMEIMTQKARIVFGEALPAVTAAAEKNANAMGMTAAQYTEAATAIGDLLVPMGFTRTEAADISTEMVNLSGALSKWTGGQISATEASEVLGKAMLGEREELKKFGIAINEADVSARLAEKGLDKLTGAALQQAKAATTLELITMKSADAQTFFADGADTLAGKKAQISAKITEVSEKLAVTLIPVFDRLLDVALKVADGISWVADAFTDLVGDEAEEAMDDKAKALAKAQQQAEALAKSTEDLTAKEKTNAELQKKLAAEAAKEKQLAKAKELAEERKKVAEKEAEDLIKAAEKLKEKVVDLQKETAIEQLSEEEQKLAKLAEKYNEQIAIATELEAKGVQEATQQRLELERLKDIALEELQQELADAKLEKDLLRIEAQEQAKFEKEVEEQLKHQEAKQQIQAFADEALLSEQALALQALETQHEDLLRLAELHGINTVDLEAAYRKKKSEVIKQFDEKDKAQLLESQKAQAQVLVQSFQAIGNVVGGVIDVLGDKAAKNTALGKLLAIAQIGISSAQAIAKATAASADVPFPGNLIAIGTAVATVLGNIAKAKNIISGVQVPQRKTGGWTTTIGATDGASYRAKYIGEAPTGMLNYTHPVLMSTATGPILANERGQEYFVNHTALQNPHVFNHVRAIDNIVRHRQMADGGPTIDATTTTAVATPTEQTNEVAIMTLQVMQELLTAIPRIRAVIPDRTLTDLVERIDELSSAGGGVLR